MTKQAKFFSRGKRQRKQSLAGRRRASEVPPAKPEAIVHVAAPIEKPWEIQGEQLTILKNAVCKGASDVELQYCLTVARRYKLDPFKRQIWFVPRWDSGADNGHGGKGANVYTPQVGIDGLLFMSARDHRDDFGSVSLPEYGPIKKVEGSAIHAPEWAKVKVFKKGTAEPTEAIAYWEEYAPSDLSKAPFWRKMPRRMIGKCATALALRQAYPDLGGIYIPEECERMAEDYTPSGRQIVAPDVSMSGSREAAQAVAARKIAEAKNGSPKPENVRETAQEPQEPANKEFLGTIELDWSENEAEPILRGDLSNLVPLIEKHCSSAKFRDGWWRLAPRDAETIREMARQLSYKLNEIVPKSPVSQERKESNATPFGSAKSEKAGNASEPTLVRGIIERCIAGQTGKNQPLRQVTILLPDKRKPTFACFDVTLFPPLDKGVGKQCAVFVVTRGKYTNLTGLKKVGSIEFDADGKTPVMSVHREAGARTLF